MRYCVAVLLSVITWLLLSPTAGIGVEVFEGHPRLFFRDSAWGERSITTAQLRERANDPRYAAYVNRLTYSECNIALRALLLDDDEAALEAISSMEERFAFGGTTTDGELVMWRAMAFDWLYNHPLFTEQKKQEVIQRLWEGAYNCRSQYIGQGAHIFHTRMYAFALGAAMAGLALEGHHEDADMYIEWADSVFTNHLFPARELQDGSVHNSLAYGRRYTMWHTGHFMSAWYSATGEDKWEQVRREQGDWAWREALFIMYGRQPDGLLVRYGDCYRRTSERFSFRVIGERAFHYDEPVGRDYLDYLFDTQASMPDSRVVEEGNAYNVLLWWDPEARTSNFRSLPGRELFSPDGTGMLFWRTGWGDDDTFIFFKCGNYFGDHGHFDQGHLEVFRGAPLLIEGGAYEGGFSSDYRMNYYRTAFSHNTLLAARPGGGDAWGQRIFSDQSQATLEDYLGKSRNETGDIIGYREEGTWSYVAGSFGKAYSNNHIDQAVREIAWIGERYLVVVDNVRMGSTTLVPRVLWHHTVEPVIEGNSFTLADGGGRATVTVLAPDDAVLDTVPPYLVSGTFYPPPDPRPELGIGRFEVTVAQADESGTYTFVQVIDVEDEGTDPGEVALGDDRQADALEVVIPTGSLRLEGEPLSRTSVTFEPAALDPPGDYTGDGALSLEDLLELLAMGIRRPANPLADFDRDGRFTILDAVSLLLHLRSSGGSTVLASADARQEQRDNGEQGKIFRRLSRTERDRLELMLDQLGLDNREARALDDLLNPATVLPRSYMLAPNSPNPFNPSTTIGYTVPEGGSGRLTLTVYDIRGRKIRVLVDESRPPGVYQAFWDGTDENGQPVSSGIYLYRLEAGEFSRVRKMVLVR